MYEKLTVKELKSKCKKRGVKGYSNLRKKDIIKLLRKHNHSYRLAKKTKSPKIKQSKKDTKDLKKKRGKKKEESMVDMLCDELGICGVKSRKEMEREKIKKLKKELRIYEKEQRRLEKERDAKILPAKIVD
jgi:hypothetical protein